MEKELLSILKEQYQKEFTGIEVIRDWIGKVYLVQLAEQKYVLKLFWHIDREAAIQSIEIMTVLRQAGVQVPKIYTTRSGSSYFEYDRKTAVLYEYVEEKEFEKREYLSIIGEYAGRMRRTMEESKVDVCRHGEEFFIQRYLKILREKNYPKVSQFEEIGHVLWNQVKDLPIGFIHGDFHDGNLFLRNGEIVAYDFDAAALASPMYDVATMCDATDYFSLREDNFIRGKAETQKNVELFLDGYQKYCKVDSKEKNAIFTFIAIRHYDIQATIIETLGIDCVDNEFLEKQLEWLKRWSKICSL